MGADVVVLDNRSYTSWLDANAGSDNVTTAPGVPSSEAS
jgi:hypothetical protein